MSTSPLGPRSHNHFLSISCLFNFVQKYFRSACWNLYDGDGWRQLTYAAPLPWVPLKVGESEKSQLNLQIHFTRNFFLNIHSVILAISIRQKYTTTSNCFYLELVFTERRSLKKKLQNVVSFCFMILENYYK